MRNLMVKDDDLSGRERTTPPDDRLRVVVVSSPRSGNTWMRGMLTYLYELTELGAHDPDDVSWSALPDRCVIQIHCLPYDNFEPRLREHGFHVVSLARHPLDLLISSLNYEQYIPNPLRWDAGDGSGERTLIGATPRSPEFLEYCCGWIGRNILSYTPVWWRRPETIKVHYEQLVAQPQTVLQRVIARIGAEPRYPIQDAIDYYAIDNLRPFYDVWHYHYWQGKPGHWRTLLPAGEARQVADAQRAAFDELGYVCDPDEGLTAQQADLNWFRLQYGSTRQHLEMERAKHAQTRRTLTETRAELESLRAELDEASEPAARAPESGSGSLGLAESTSRASRLQPRLYAAFRRIVGSQGAA